MALPDGLPYYPRHELLESVLRVLLAGQNVTLFAPRRHGKTLFIREELLPAVEEQGWFAARVDLWRNRAKPALGLVEGLEAVAYATKAADRGLFGRKMDLRRMTTTFRSPGVEIQGQWEPAVQRPQIAAETTLENRLANALHLIADHGTHALLALDEFQALAQAGNENFVAAFRTALQDVDGRLSVIFTGSSRDGLNNLFRKAKAPLFRSATAVPMAELGDGFVDNRADYLRDIAGLEVDREALKLLFQKLLRTPLFLNEIVVGMLTRGDADVEKAMAEWLADKQANEYQDVLSGLRPVDLAVVNWLTESGQQSVYSAEAREHMREFMGATQAPTAAVVQSAIRRLGKADIVDPMGTYGSYQLADQGMQIVLQSQIGTDA